MQSQLPLFSLHSNRAKPARKFGARVLVQGRREAFANCLAIVLAAASLAPSKAQADNEWANWRGPNHNGSATEATPPSQWGPETNIEWKIPLGGLGSSTPIVWGDQIIVHTAVAKAVPGAEPAVSETEPTPSNATSPAVKLVSQERPDRPGRGRMSNPKPTAVYQFTVTSYDLKSGAEQWQTVVTEEIPHEAGHSTNNFASSSPVTDGKHIYSFFGSRGLFCLDMAGKKIWQADLGQQSTRNEFGEASSAALYKDRVIVQWDHEGESFIAAFDAISGDLKLKTPRAERTNWCTPLVVQHQGVDQVIANGRKIRSYDLATGKLIWEVGSLTENPIPSPIHYKDFIIATTGFRGAACYAISLDAKGELAEDSEFVKWTYHQNTPYVPSPVLYKDQLYFISENKAILSCINATTGEPVFARTRLNGLDTIYSSVGAADDKIFVTGRNGTTVVLKAGGEKEVLATNELGEEIDASPVFVGDRLLLRSDKHLYSIRAKN